MYVNGHKTLIISLSYTSAHAREHTHTLFPMRQAVSLFLGQKKSEDDEWKRHNERFNEWERTNENYGEEIDWR